MPMRRERYPDDWDEISRRIRFDRAQGRCEWPGCGGVNGEPHPVTGSVVVLTVAHVDQDTSNNEDANLRAWCQMHHLRWDANQHSRNAAITRSAPLDGQPTLPGFARMFERSYHP